MKRKRYQLVLLILTISSLVLLVGIQISWVLKSARMQEAQFNHTVTLAMNRIVETLSNNQSICREMNNCIMANKSGSCFRAMKNQIEWSKLDTLIRNDLKYYNINLDYEFDVVEKGTMGATTSGGQVYKNDNLDRVLDKSGYELRLRFPEKSEFIKAQIGYIFISSIALLLLLSVSFILIYRFYKSENRFTRNMIDFINNMTHEFKTPLTNIALANSMISKNVIVEGDEKLGAYSKVIKNEHLRLKEKVEILLKATITENEQSSDNEIFNAADEIRNVADTFSVQILEKRGVIDIELLGGSYNLSGNIEMFQVAIGNLIDNAIKYNKKNPKIKIRLEVVKNLLSISITDNGIGINKENLNQIFEKFYRIPTGDVHDNEGFGLGLYFVRKTVLQMQGKIRVSSQIENGTCFTMEFPVLKEL